MGANSTGADLWRALETLQDPQPVWNKPAFIIAITAVSLGFATICIIFRLYTRLRVVRSPGWDDAFVTMYLLTGIMAGVSLCISTEFGNGEHLLHLVLTPGRLRRFLKTFYVTNAAITMSMTIIKLSLLFQYLRLFPASSNHPTTRLATIATLVMVGAVGIGYTAISWFPCWPVSDYWDFNYLTGGGKRCWGFASANRQQFYYTYLSWNILNVVGDVVILALPLGMFWDPDTDGRTKRGLVGLIGMGVVANGLCIWRLVETVLNRAGTFPTFDPPWNAPVIMVLAMLEVNLSSICASVPVFWPVLTAQIGRVFVTREVSVTRSIRDSIFRQQQQQQQGGGKQQSREGAHGDVVQQQQQHTGDGITWDTSDGSDSEQLFSKSPRALTFTHARSHSVSTTTATLGSNQQQMPPWGFRSVRANSEASVPSGQRGRDDSVSSSLSTMLAELEKGGGGGGGGGGVVVDTQQQQHYADRFVQGQVNPLMPGNNEFAVEAGAVSLSSVSRKGSGSSRKFSVAS